MKDWIIWAGVYIYLAQMSFRIYRQPPKPLPWLLTIPMTVLAPLVLAVGFVMMLPGRLRNLRHFRFKGFMTRQRRSVLGDLADYQPDDGGFLDAATTRRPARQAMAHTPRTHTRRIRHLLAMWPPWRRQCRPRHTQVTSTRARDVDRQPPASTPPAMPSLRQAMQHHQRQPAHQADSDSITAMVNDHH